MYILLFSLLSCNSGTIEVLCNLPDTLDEVSGIAMTKNENIFWMIEDSGNKDHIYAVSKSGKIIKDFNLDNTAKNKDWEALTSDPQGNLYIGDFGNNHLDRKSYDIYKVAIDQLHTDTHNISKKITFKLPKKQNPLDFEGFIVLNDDFYIFSKEKPQTSVWKVPNKIGSHIAKFVTSFSFDDRSSQVTGAAINANQNSIALLNHDKVWILKDFVGTDFFEGTILQLPFAHDSQKEGVCFYGNDTLYITDERVKGHDGNLYKLDMKL